MGIRGRRDRLERRLQAERPQPAHELVSALAERVVAEPIRGSSGWRVAFAAGFTALLVVAFALTGGIGYAASAVQGGTAAVTSLVTAPSKATKSKKKAAQRQRASKRIGSTVQQSAQTQLSSSLSTQSSSSSLSTQSNSLSTLSSSSSLSTQSSSDEESDDEEEDEEDDDGPADDQYEDDELICHHRQDGSGETRTISVDADEVARHLAHGDTLGPCPDDDDDEEDDD